MAKALPERTKRYFDRKTGATTPRRSGKGTLYCTEMVIHVCVRLAIYVCVHSVVYPFTLWRKRHIRSAPPVPSDSVDERSGLGVRFTVVHNDSVLATSVHLCSQQQIQRVQPTGCREARVWSHILAYRFSTPTGDDRHTTYITRKGWMFTQPHEKESCMISLMLEQMRSQLKREKLSGETQNDTCTS